METSRRRCRQADHPASPSKSTAARTGSSATRRRFTDSDELLQARFHRPEDRKLSAILVAVVGAGMACLLTYLAVGAC